MPKDRRKQTKASKILDVFRKKEMRGKSAWERKYRRARNKTKETKKDEFFTWKGKKYKASFRDKPKTTTVFPDVGKEHPRNKDWPNVRVMKGGGLIQHD